MKHFIKNLPKAELHVHIEGTLEPELLLFLAQKNNVKVPYNTVNDIRNFYATIHNYNAFYHAYSTATTVLCTENDFFQVALAYCTKAAAQGVVHAEIFFDTQTYLHRGISSHTVINGIYEGLKEGKRLYDMSSFLILCCLRHLSQEDAIDSLKKALPYKKYIKAVGLACSEVGNPPSKFSQLFQLAAQEGFHRVAHAGEHASSEYIWQALTLLGVERIDHGVACLEDKELVTYLQEKKIGLTVCPVSNKVLSVVPSLADHPLKKMLDYNLMVSINSDDPAFFGSYIASVMQKTKDALGLSREQLVQCAQNSFITSFLSSEEKKHHLKNLFNYVQSYI